MDHRIKLVKLLDLTASTVDSEALNAIRHANKLCNDHGLTWTELLGSCGTPSSRPPTPAQLNAQLLNSAKVEIWTDLPGWTKHSHAMVTITETGVTITESPYYGEHAESGQPRKMFIPKADIISASIQIPTPAR
jgi:hypothetical protein